MESIFSASAAACGNVVLSRVRLDSICFNGDSRREKEAANLKNEEKTYLSEGRPQAVHLAAEGQLLMTENGTFL